MFTDDYDYFGQCPAEFREAVVHKCTLINSFGPCSPLSATQQRSLMGTLLISKLQFLNL